MKNVHLTLNETVWARLGPSKIHGVGVFAIRDIPKGTCFAEVPFRIAHMPMKDLELVRPEIRDIFLSHWFSLHDEDEMRIRHPNGYVDLVCFLNHSDEPNAHLSYTLRDIKKGEELTEDYRAVFGGRGWMRTILSKYPDSSAVRDLNRIAKKRSYVHASKETAG